MSRLAVSEPSIQAPKPTSGDLEIVADESAEPAGHEPAVEVGSRRALQNGILIDPWSAPLSMDSPPRTSSSTSPFLDRAACHAGQRPDSPSKAVSDCVSSSSFPFKAFFTRALAPTEAVRRSRNPDASEPVPSSYRPHQQCLFTRKSDRRYGSLQGTDNPGGGRNDCAGRKGRRGKKCGLYPAAGTLPAGVRRDEPIKKRCEFFRTRNVCFIRSAGATCGSMVSMRRLHILFELVNDTDEHAMAVIEQVADITFPQM